MYAILEGYSHWHKVGRLWEYTKDTVSAKVDTLAERRREAARNKSKVE